MIKKYIINNRIVGKFTVFEIILASFLFFTFSFLFSSFRNFMIGKIEKEIGNYHVIIKSNVIKSDVILSNEYIDGRNFIVYKDIKLVYKNTDKICLKYKCERVTYNDSLLSLYGLSKNKNISFVLNRLFFFLILFLSIVIFFILYNSFKANLLIRRNDVYLFKLIGADNVFLFKLFFKEAIILGVFSVFVGFILSFIFSYLFIFFINKVLFELLNGNMTLSLNFYFCFFFFIFIFLVICLSSIFPLKGINKYKIMDLFRKNNDYDGTILFKGNLVVFLSRVNLERCFNSFKSLIICIFLFCFSLSIFLIILSYGIKCFKSFVNIPNYDLKVSYDGEYDFSKVISDLNSKRKNSFKSCYLKANIDNDNFLHGYTKSNDILVTNLGGNEIVNIFDGVLEKNGKITHFHYVRFKKPFDIFMENGEVLSELKFTDKIPFGLESSFNIIVNLDDDRFDTVCDSYESNLFLETDYVGIDNYFNNLIKKEKIGISYFNAKKVKQIINNLIFSSKLFLIVFLILILLILISTSFSVSFISILNRRSDFASMRAMGLESKTIYFCLLFESLYVSFLGLLFSLPFIFVFNKLLFISISRVFSFDKIILGIDKILFSFFLSFFCTFISSLFSYLFFCNKSLISSIKNNV